MSGSWPDFHLWLLRTAVGGGSLLLLNCLILKRCRQPAWRQRAGEWGQAAALLMALLAAGPVWLAIPILPASHAHQAEPVAALMPVPDKEAKGSDSPAPSAGERLIADIQNQDAADFALAPPEP